MLIIYAWKNRTPAYIALLLDKFPKRRILTTTNLLSGSLFYTYKHAFNQYEKHFIIIIFECQAYILRISEPVTKIFGWTSYRPPDDHRIPPSVMWRVTRKKLKNLISNFNFWLIFLKAEVCQTSSCVIRFNPTPRCYFIWLHTKNF